MRIINWKQGTPEWLQERSKRHCASDAAAMMGFDKRTSRNELLRLKSSGDSKVFSQWVMDNLLARGHEVEAQAIALLEAETGESFFPVTATDDDGYLLASFDGLSMGDDVAVEHKMWNDALAAYIKANDDLPDTHWPQCEQECHIAGLDQILFVVSDGTAEKRVMLNYQSKPERIKKLLASWKQWDIDLAEYQHVEVAPAAVAAPIMALPALSIQVNGSISLIDNLAVFGEKLTQFIAGVNKEPQDDQAFADLEAAAKTLQTAQDALEAAEANALAQTSDIDTMRRTVAMYAKLARDNRLMFEKLVKAKKDTLRAEIVGEGAMAFRKHVDGLNARLGRNYMPAVPVDFAGAAKGKRTIAGLREAVNNELVRGKIAANEIADRIQINVAVIFAQPDYAFLFNDAASIVTKAADDFAILVESRINAHKVAEAAKLEKERERIRAEEVAKLEREAEAKRRAEIAEQEAQARATAEAERKRQESLQRPQEQPAPVIPSVAPRAQHAPIPAPAAWGGGTTKVVQRPPDFMIVRAVAQAFHVHAETATEWLKEIDFSDIAA